MAATGDARAYRFDPLDHSGVLFGLSAGPCVALGVAIAAGVIALSAGVAIGAAVAAPLAVAAVTVPRPGGRALWERVPTPAVWWRTRDHNATWLGRLGDRDLWRDAPPCLAGLSAGDSPAGIADRRAHTVTVALRVFGPRLSLRDPADHDLALGLWADVLNQLGADPDVVGVAWSDHTSIPAAAAADEVSAAVAARAVHHDVVVTLSVRAERRDLARVERVVAGAYRALASAGIAADPPVDANGLARLAAQRGDPFAATSPARPLAVRAEWDRCRIDGAVHRSYWVASWPALPVTAGWLDGFLAVTGVTRTFAVAFVPVARHQSRRRIERDLVKLESDATTRAERGRRVDARHRRATQTLLDREHELVEGHGEFAYTGVVTVSAPDDDTLGRHARLVEQLALEAGLELRALHGRHDLGWAATLPLGVAPRMAAT